MIQPGAGVIDADYRGTVFVLLFNSSDQNFEVKEGDRIAQLILEKINTKPAEEVTDLDETTRGSGGFGSTGINRVEIPEEASVRSLNLDREILMTISVAPITDIKCITKAEALLDSGANVICRSKMGFPDKITINATSASYSRLQRGWHEEQRW